MNSRVQDHVTKALTAEEKKKPAAVAAAAAAPTASASKPALAAEGRDTDRPAVHCTQAKFSPSSVPGSHLIHWLRSSDEIEPYGQSRQRSPARELNCPSLHWEHWPFTSSVPASLKRSGGVGWKAVRGWGSDWRLDSALDADIESTMPTSKLQLISSHLRCDRMLLRYGSVS